ncbi:hypothetical protein C8J56DRAFT_1171975 [Mycena floridula]|nr:hypothetical protein C8J56DRAFT_1171975 [Mycena floridula]
MPKAPPASTSKAVEKEKREPNAYHQFFKVEYAKYKLQHRDEKLKKSRTAVIAMWKDSTDNPNRGNTFKSMSKTKATASSSDGPTEKENDVPSKKFHMESFSLLVERLIASNDPPREEEVPKLRTVLAEIDGKIEENFEEILRLEQSLKAAHKNRGKMLEFKASLPLILSPARRLPGDVIFEIIRRASIVKQIDSQSETVFFSAVSLDVKQGPWPFGAICRLWRIVSITNAVLWSYIVVKEDSSSPKKADPKILHTILDRSKKCPLTIHFANFETTSSAPVLLPLLAHSKRWVGATLYVLDSGFSELAELLRSVAMPNLEALKVGLPFPSAPVWRPLETLDFLRFMPRLADLTLSFIVVGSNGTGAKFPTLKLFQLKRLSLSWCAEETLFRYLVAPSLEIIDCFSLAIVVPITIQNQWPLRALRIDSFAQMGLEFSSNFNQWLKDEEIDNLRRMSDYAQRLTTFGIRHACGEKLIQMSQVLSASPIIFPNLQHILISLASYAIDIETAEIILHLVHLRLNRADPDIARLKSVEITTASRPAESDIRRFAQIIRCLVDEDIEVSINSYRLTRHTSGEQDWSDSESEAQSTVPDESDSESSIDNPDYEEGRYWETMIEDAEGEDSGFDYIPSDDE